MVEAHPAHGRCWPWLDRAKRHEVHASVAAHSLAEAYAVLTTLPLRPRIPPVSAARLLRENLASALRLVALTQREYWAIVLDASIRGLSGGVVYDALIARAAAKARADVVVTLNPSDFQRVLAGGSIDVREP
jgi:predicted nucleic acid-binding protein